MPTNWVTIQPMTITKTILTSIPEDLLEAYKAHKMTSTELGKATGYHPASLRRAIDRPKKVSKDLQDVRLKIARYEFRMSIGHLPPAEICKLANVSMATAGRIRKAYKKRKEMKNAH